MVVVWQVYQVPGSGYESSHGPIRGGEEGKTGSTNQPTNQPTNFYRYFQHFWADFKRSWQRLTTVQFEYNLSFEVSNAVKKEIFPFYI